MSKIAQCAQCHTTIATPEGTWDEMPGWGCLYGTLAICSVACAKAFATRLGHKTLRDDDVDWEGTPNQESQKEPTR